MQNKFFMNIKDNLNKIKSQLPEHVTLVAVSKTKPNEDILEAYDAGQRIFGENKAQELITKQPQLPEDIQWHYIGHLQSNKVKYLAPFVSLVHSIDRKKILKELNKEGKKNDRVINGLLQFHIAEETSKFGLSLDECRTIIDNEGIKNYPHVNIAGVMGMATFTGDEEQIRKEFRQLKSIFDTLKLEYFADSETFKEISMGMSNDYRIAIEEGSTMLRIGSSIFGPRNIKK